MSISEELPTRIIASDQCFRAGFMELASRQWNRPIPRPLGITATRSSAARTAQHFPHVVNDIAHIHFLPVFDSRYLASAMRDFEPFVDPIVSRVGHKRPAWKNPAQTAKSAYDKSPSLVSRARARVALLRKYCESDHFREQQEIGSRTRN